MKSVTFHYAKRKHGAHLVIERDGHALRYGKMKGKVKVLLLKAEEGPTLRQFKLVEDIAQRARKSGAKIVFKKHTYPWEPSHVHPCP